MKKQQYDRFADGQAGEGTDAANMGLRQDSGTRTAGQMN